MAISSQGGWICGFIIWKGDIMNESKGYIKVYRSLLDNPVVCKDADHLAVWIYLLCESTHKEVCKMFNGKKITLQPGQLLTGRKVISDKLSISESKTKRILILFESDHQIERQRGTKSSLISIVNWDKYQCGDQQNDQQMTSKRPASDQQVTTLQECKNVKNERMKEKEDILSEIDPSLHETFNDYLEFRKVNKMKDTLQAKKLLVTALKKESAGDLEYAKAIIEQSIVKGYKSFFPVKDYKEQKKRQKDAERNAW